MAGKLIEDKVRVFEILAKNLKRLKKQRESLSITFEISEGVDSRVEEVMQIDQK